MPFSYIKTCKINKTFTFDLASTKVINNYLLKQNKLVIYNYKIKVLHQDKKVIDNSDSISIFDSGQRTKIYTSGKKINDSKPKIKEELPFAIDAIKNNFQEVYLIYPKAGDFKKNSFYIK